MKGELIAEIILEYRVGRGIAGCKGQPQRTKLWRPRRHGVLTKDGRQCRRIRFAFVFPDELALGVDEIRRGRLDDAKRACPASLIILGELHLRAGALADRGKPALEFSTRAVKSARRHNDDDHGRGVDRDAAQSSIQAGERFLRAPVCEIHQRVSRGWPRFRQIGRHADMAGDRLSQGGLLGQIRPPGWQSKGLPPGWKIHCEFRFRQLTSGAGRYADLLSVGRDLGALDPEADLTDIAQPSRFGHNELMLVREGSLSA